MKKALFIIMVCVQYAQGQTIIQRDTKIEQMVKEVSADSLKSYVDKLVSFGTRHTLSSTTNNKRGIGASRLWVVQKFKEFAKNTNG